MKGTIYILALFLLAGCAEKKDAVLSDRPVFFTSILPQAGLAKAIAGEHADILTLVGAGQSPHAFEPTAKQLIQLAEAEALFTIGVPFERTLLEKIRSLYPKLEIVETQRGIALRSMPHEHHGEACAHDHGGRDPHVWLAPANAKRIVETIAQTFIKADPNHAADYRENAKRLDTELDQLDAEIRALLAPHQGSRFYVFHPSFGYFADAYGLTQIPIELDGKSPSPRQLAELIEQAKADDVKVIFMQMQFPASSARVIADSIGGSVVQLDPLAEDSIANLRRIADSISRALNP